MNRLASENQYSVGQHASIRVRAMLTQAYRDELGKALSDAFPALASSIAREMEEPAPAQNTV